MSRVSIIETGLEFNSEPTERPSTELLVVHHVGGTNRDVAADEIHQWHINNGWAGIGYHYVIRKDGSVERGRPKGAIGAHAYGFNSKSVGINVVGDYENFWPTLEQVNSLRDLLADLCEIYALTPDRDVIVGHRELMGTDCPGEHLFEKLDGIVGEVAKLIEGG